jgi:Holliday junction resolvasome RuvABC endonuclease subunit
VIDPTIVAGIDYSIRCPAICVIQSESTLLSVFRPFSECHFYYLSSINSHVIQTENIHGNNLVFSASQPDRFQSIAEWALMVLKHYPVNSVGIEGYAFGARGRSLFDLAENTGLLKYVLYENAIPYDIHAPTKVKRFGTGVGNADKDYMALAFEERTGVNLNSMFGRKKDRGSKSPVNDLVDAYFIACLQRMNGVLTALEIEPDGE